MPAKVNFTGFNEFIKMTNEADIGLTRRTREQMRKEAKLIVEQAQRNAPVDWKHHARKELERSIRIVEDKDERRRVMITIGAGGVVDGVNVDAYVMEMHEGLAPYGDGKYHLGPLSILKAALDPRNRVGGQFMSRALDEYKDEVPKNIMSVVLDYLSGFFR